MSFSSDARASSDSGSVSRLMSAVAISPKSPYSGSLSARCFGNVHHLLPGLLAHALLTVALAPAGSHQLGQELVRQVPDQLLGQASETQGPVKRCHLLAHGRRCLDGLPGLPELHLSDDSSFMVVVHGTTLPRARKNRPTGRPVSSLTCTRAFRLSH